jgi:hypothetical protein
MHAEVSRFNGMPFVRRTLRARTEGDENERRHGQEKTSHAAW